MVSNLSCGESVRCVGFLPERIASVALVRKNVGYGADVPFAFFAGGILSIEQGNDLIHALPGEVVSENAPDGIGLLFIYYYLMILDSVSKGDGGRKKRAAFHAALVAPADILGNRLALLLRDGGEGGGEQFAGHIGGVNVLLLKADANADGLQFPDGLEAVHGIPREAGNGFHQYLVDPAFAAIGEEPLEIRALFRRGSGNPGV